MSPKNRDHLKTPGLRISAPLHVQSSRSQALSQQSAREQNFHNVCLKTQLEEPFAELEDTPSPAQQAMFRQLKSNEATLQRWFKERQLVSKKVKPSEWNNIAIPLKDGLSVMIRSVEELQTAVQTVLKYCVLNSDFINDSLKHLGVQINHVIDNVKDRMVLMLKGIEQEIRMVREQTSEILEERVEEVKKEFAESLQDQTVRFK